MPEPTRRHLTHSDQDHLRAIHSAGGASERVAMGKIARQLGHSPATVTAAAKRLHALGLVDYQRYRGVRLSEAGVRVALEMVRHHRLIELFLVEVLGYDWDDVDEEADRLEHAMSEEFERRIAARVSDPTTDPHGQLIPSEMLESPRDEARQLSLLAPGANGVVAWVSDRNREILTYLAQIGLVPGTEIRVRERLPFEGPLVVVVGDRDQHLSRQVTDSVYVLVANGAAASEPAGGAKTASLAWRAGDSE